MIHYMTQWIIDLLRTHGAIIVAAAIGMIFWLRIRMRKDTQKLEREPFS